MNCHPCLRYKNKILNKKQIKIIVNKNKIYFSFEKNLINKMF